MIVAKDNYPGVFQFEHEFKAGRKSFWGGLCGSSRALAVSQLVRQTGKVLVVITPDLPATDRFIQDIRFYLGRHQQHKLLSFPDWETLPYDLLSPHQDIVSERLATLTELTTLKSGVLVVSVTTMMHYLVPKDFLLLHSLRLRRGQVLDLDKFKHQLDASGYMFVPLVTEHGDVSVRGSLIDLYPLGSAKPYRIDLLDKEIESIREFEPETQRSLRKVDEIKILPGREIHLSDQQIDQFISAWNSYFPNDDAMLSPIYQDVKKRFIPEGIEYYLPLFYPQTSTLFDYLPDGSAIVFYDNVIDAAESFWLDITVRYEKIRQASEHPLLPPENLFLNSHDFLGRADRYHQIHVSNKLRNDGAGVVNYDTRPSQNLRIDARAADPLLLFRHFINDFSGRILLIMESAGRKEMLLDLLRQHQINIVQVPGWCEFVETNIPLALTVSPIGEGMQIEHPKIALITEKQLFGKRTVQSRRRNGRRGSQENIIHNLTELTLGAPVVHEAYGIGRYLGLCTLDVEGLLSEFMLIEYAEGDKLYVPISDCGLVSHFTGADPEHVFLSRLGSSDWTKAKRKAAKRIYDVAAELLELHAQRAMCSGFKFEFDQHAYQAFAQSFLFEETVGQAQAIDAVIDDMTQASPMDRLICGDTGFGKTEVAMRASFIAIQNGRQVAILVPTTLLAQQHLKNFEDRFSDWPVHISMLSRFCTGKQQREIATGIEDGTIDIIIGTHKLLQRGIKFARLGLLIIDEEHRFGVRQKEKIKAMRGEVDVLTLTATPIPRTLNMALSGIREFSIISTPPEKRLAVKTFVGEWRDELIKEALLRELKRGGQAYILHNKVDSIEKRAQQIALLLPEANIKYAHGQMPERELEQVMSDFYRRRFNILVCTTIIETGIDIPNANTIIIDRADRFGLAQIYQLRGRVGRSHRRAYAYLIRPPKKYLTTDALKRLEAVEALEDLGVGFILSTHDLEIRGAGDILGDEQSGQIQKIGYTLYIDLLNRAINELKSGRHPDLDRLLEHGIEIELHIPALIPDDYLPDVNIRLGIYKRVAGVSDEQELKRLRFEIIDRFGPLPEFAKNLFRIRALKLKAESLGISRINMDARGGSLQFNGGSVDSEKLVNLIHKDPLTYRPDGGDKLRINKILPSAEERFTMLKNLLADISC